ncbi:hypothetical protein [Amycolatopsis sp. Hca4]|uniref:hypothetical protein n=1 Tax=Amycolatopsis sp. Hca4 TaxID=2742131 RepID=UPI0015911E19|nr:hypothetical protein [Amycolatopsis sp. Hca4]QKV76039.1 hypothetical protein HUT10_21385 [Amycolatopsis sp. Hca4]
MLTAVLTTLLSSGAVLLGVVLTMRTQRFAAVSTARMSLLEGQSARLREALAEELTLTYLIENAYRRAMDTGSPWPGPMAEKVEREDRLFTLVRLQLDESLPRHRKLLDALDRLREHNAEEVWLTRRNAVITAVNEALAADVERILRR